MQCVIFFHKVEFIIFGIPYSACENQVDWWFFSQNLDIAFGCLLLIVRNAIEEFNIFKTVDYFQF